MKLYQAFNSVFNGKDTKTGLEILQKGNTQQGVLKNEKEKKRGGGGDDDYNLHNCPCAFASNLYAKWFFLN